MPSHTQRFSHLLTPLHCTEQDSTMLRELAETLIVHNMEQYNSLELAKNGAPANKSRWKEVRKKEVTRVFKERATKGEPLEMASLVLLGTVVGKLEDVMYAVVAPSTDAMRIKSAIIQDGVVDCKVLHEVVTPTMDDPFHHVNVTWRLLAEPDLRDHVCLDSTGIATTAQGERVGYHLTHSVGFEQVPSLASYDVTRGNMSVCSLYVQSSPSTVRVYVRGFFDFNQNMVTNAALNTIATHWMSFPRKVECAQLKKLLWTVHKNNNRESIMSLTSDEGKAKTPMAPPTPGLCKVCSKSFGFLGTSRKFCGVCNDQICARCSVTKTVVMIASNQSAVVEKKRVFCVQCINDVVHTDAVRIAREEILNAGRKRSRQFGEISANGVASPRLESPIWRLASSHSTFIVMVLNEPNTTSKETSEGTAGGPRKLLEALVAAGADKEEIEWELLCLVHLDEIGCDAWNVYKEWVVSCGGEEPREYVHVHAVFAPPRELIGTPSCAPKHLRPDIIDEANSIINQVATLSIQDLAAVESLERIPALTGPIRGPKVPTRVHQASACLDALQVITSPGPNYPVIYSIRAPHPVYLCSVLTWYGNFSVMMPLFKAPSGERKPIIMWDIVAPILVAFLLGLLALGFK